MTSSFKITNCDLERPGPLAGHAHDRHHSKTSKVTNCNLRRPAVARFEVAARYIPEAAQECFRFCIEICDVNCVRPFKVAKCDLKILTAIGNARH
jgi:hypothetical protein